MSRFDYVGLGDTARDLWLKQLIDDLEKQIEESVDAAFDINIEEASNGQITITLLNHDGQVLSSANIDTTKKIIKSAEVDYDHKNIVLTCLDDTVINCDISNILDTLSNKVDKIGGKGLSTNDFTTELKTKLEGIEASADENVIEVVKVDGTALPVNNKEVNIDLSGKVDKVPGKQLSTNDYTTAEKTKLAGIATNAQVNVLEGVKVDGNPLTITDKFVNVDLSGKVDKVNGKGLSTNDFTDAYMNKLDNIQAGSQVNVLEVVKVNGTPLTNTNKSVDIDLTGKVDKIAGKGLSTNDFTDTYKAQLDELEADLDSKVNVQLGMGLSNNNFTDAYKNKLDGIELGAQANVITQIQVDGAVQIPSNKSVNIIISGKVDKINEAFKVYGTDSGGEQAQYGIDTNNADISVGNIVKRNSTGNVTVPGNPSVGTDATSKQYVDVFAKTLDASLNTSNYQLTLTLKDKNENILSQRIIDFPAEFDVTGITYNENTQSLIVAYRNGTTSSVSIANLINGLQTEITQYNKLPSGLVDDTGDTDHQFITQGLKQQITTNQDNIALKANSSDVYTKDEMAVILNSKQNNLSNYPAYTGKGTATKIPSISTNELGQVTNITEILFDGMPLSTRYGRYIDLNFNSERYVLTAQLKDQDNTLLATSSEINLPVESVVTNIDYDDVNKQITISYNKPDGTTGSVTISLYDMINGLVPNDRTIAGIDLTDDISVSQLSNALFTITDVTIDED